MGTQAQSIDTGRRFDLFQMVTDRVEWWWHVYSDDGAVVDAWDRDRRYDDDLERMVGGRAFPTEQAAREWLAEHYPDAIDVHTPMTAERMAELDAWAETTNAAAAAAAGEV